VGVGPGVMRPGARRIDGRARRPGRSVPETERYPHGERPEVPRPLPFALEAVRSRSGDMRRGRLDSE